jgi:hypothetical protein
MGIKQRIVDAEHLWNAGQKEGAWIQVMIATAATARKRYPRPMSDNKAFKQYIRDISFTILSGLPKPPNLKNAEVVIKFGTRPFEDVLYKDYRCAWIHEGGLDSVGLSEFKIVDGQIVDSLVVGDNTQLPSTWIINLIQAIRLSPENLEEFNQ